MIQIADKRECCGCHACVQKCPRQCISMQEDCEGFLYPKIDVASCVECGLCEMVCPMLNVSESREPMEVCAVKSADDKVRMASSSGGLFTMLAEQTIAEGGAVFGAKFSEGCQKVLHSAAEDMDGVAAFRGSKYVQSVIGDSYQQAERMLKAGRKVLFSATPCQIAGLKRYLGKEYENLLTVDVACHGVPSPLVWREYLQSVVPHGESVQKVNMRDKQMGWSAYRVNITTDKRTLSQPASENLYIEGFLRDIYLRPSCYDCPAKAGRSGSDITLGDFWGVANLHPEFMDERGVGFSLAWSKQGVNIVRKTECSIVESSYNNAKEFNPCIERSVAEPELRELFWEKFEQEGVAAIERACRRMRPNILSRIILKLKTVLWHIIHRK